MSFFGGEYLLQNSGMFGCFLQEKLSEQTKRRLFFWGCYFVDDDKL